MTDIQETTINKEKKVNKKIELTAEERAAEIRKKLQGKRPYHGLRSRFPQLPKRQGFVTHWFNDENGRIEESLNFGWEFSKRAGFVDEKIDLLQHPNKRIRVRVGSKEDYSDLYAYAMDIPEEIYNEYRTPVETECKRREDAIFGRDKDSQVKFDGSIKAEVTKSDYDNNFTPN